MMVVRKSDDRGSPEAELIKNEWMCLFWEDCRDEKGDVTILMVINLRSHFCALIVSLQIEVN